MRYAQKACGNLAILDRMRKKVVVDAVSWRNTQGNGCWLLHGSGKHEIVYTADIFDREALDLVVKHSLPVNCGSPDMISQLGERRPGADDVESIRIRSWPARNKYRWAAEQAQSGTPDYECLRRADQTGVTVTGLHMHIGSGTDLEHLSEVCDAMSGRLKRSDARSRPSVQVVDCRSLTRPTKNTWTWVGIISFGMRRERV